jgi:thiamine-phosphate pyrophosphorylase
MHVCPAIRVRATAGTPMVRRVHSRFPRFPRHAIRFHARRFETGSAMRRFPRGLYAISDGPRPDLVTACAAALRGGACALQYRDKTADAARRLVEARALARCCAAHGVPLVVNDDAGLAAAVGCGVHLGRDDADPAVVRHLVGDDAVIGVSCYDSLERARDAVRAGADYLAFGAFFASPTKPAATRAAIGLLREAQSLGLPLVAIGGITPDNARMLIDAGADCVAVVSAVFADADVESAARRFADLFEPRA